MIYSAKVVSFRYKIVYNEKNSENENCVNKNPSRSLESCFNKAECNEVPHIYEFSKP